jgi:hypothetical protein
MGTINVRKPIPKTCAKGSRSRVMKDEKGEATHLFGVSHSSVKPYARAWFLPPSTQGKDNGGESMNVVMFLYRTNLPYSIKTHPWCIRI